MILTLSLIANVILFSLWRKESNEANKWFMKWSKPMLNSQLEQNKIFKGEMQ